ncbi:putative ribonuclease H-like domain-containing protein [Tanacetum coccineum]
MPSPRLAAYPPKEVMYRYYHPHLTSEIPSGESKVHIEVLSVLWGNRLSIPDGSLPLSSLLDAVRITAAQVYVSAAQLKKAQRRLEVKARITLMMGIPNEHQLKFNSIKDAKKLLEAIRDLDQKTFDRLQKLVSQLELLDEKLSQEDVNLKKLKGCLAQVQAHSTWLLFPLEITTLASIMKKLILLMEFLFQPNSPQLVHEDLQQIHPDDMEEMDLRWKMAMLTMRDKSVLKNTGRKLTINGNKTIGFDNSKVECYNCHKRGHFARECRASRNQDNKNKESSRRSVPVETSTSTTLVSCDSLGFRLEDYYASSTTLTQVISSSKLDISFTGLVEFVNEPVVENCKAMSSGRRAFKGNLVRGLPSKLFENDQTCVACQKGKQHKASCKSKIENSISLPLHLLHMDLFGPTFVKSLMKKMYCLVVIDDYSRFTWVFFLATKDETSGILKSFITGIENLVDHKVKVIRCDNGTEFKNKEMNQFCEMKGILRQFSVARTPQQNGVAKRRNMTLIEAARTMLADSKLPTTF